MAGAEIESCFCGPALAGTAGTGCEPDGEAQQLILPPQWQHPRAGWAAVADVGAASNCAHTRKKLNKMALARRPFKIS
jgi:hypothetical protein